MPAGSERRADGPASLANLSGRYGQGKLAARVASRIVDDVVARGWPVGEVLGSSEEMLERFDISRAVFREAVRLLEHQGVARTRRGPGGGLVVAEPSVEAILDASVLYLHRVGARVEEVDEAKLVLKDIAADLTAGREDEGTGNPALDLFVDLVDRVTLLYGRRKALLPEAALAAPAGHKRAELVARSIYHGVVSGRLEPGHLLGSEPDLMEHHGVSRAVFREAVRLLEHHHIAAMRRGPGGGLFVAAPSSAAVADVVAIYLARHGAGIPALAALRGRYEVALVDLVVDRLDATGIAMLDDALEVGEDDDQGDISIHNLHANIARLTGNRVLELLALVLIRLTRFHQYWRLAPGEGKPIRDEVNRVHVGIARAIQSREKDLARKRVGRHLEVLMTKLR